MPVDRVCVKLGQQLGEAEPRELCYTPVMDETVVATDVFVTSSGLFHNSFLLIVPSLTPRKGPAGGRDPGYRAFLMRVRENRQRQASTMDNASTAEKSPMNCEATPTPITGMIRPQ